MANQIKVWNGSAWLDGAPKVWDGTTWSSKAPLYWDGAEWMPAAPTPHEFPSWVASTKGSFANKDIAELALPAGTRTGDYIVSICAQQPGEPDTAHLVEPEGVVPTLYTFPSGLHLHVAGWFWEPSRGTRTTWDVAGSPHTTLMHLTYRGGDPLSVSAPVSEITEHQDVNTIPLMPAQRFTSLYIAVAASDTLTGFAWPDGITSRCQHLGVFGQEQVSFIAADTPGGSGSPGDLALDTTVKHAVMVLVTIPGRGDGNPTWILGDTTNSTLNESTYVG